MKARKENVNSKVFQFVTSYHSFKGGVTLGVISVTKQLPKNLNTKRLIEGGVYKYYTDRGKHFYKTASIKEAIIGGLRILYIDSGSRVNIEEKRKAFQDSIDEYKFQRSFYNNGREFVSLSEEKNFLQSAYNLYGRALFEHPLLRSPFKKNVFFMAFERACIQAGGNNIPSAKDIFTIYYKIAKRNGLWLESK